MKNISEQEVLNRIRLENPWWGETPSIDLYFRDMKPRAYLDGLYKLVTEKTVRRAVVLMGSRRVGKTVLLHHVIQKLIDSGVAPERICYVSIDSPVYTGHSLEDIIKRFMASAGFKGLAGCYIFFDEIQYLKGWEVHLKRLVDDFREEKFIASGSAAAALKLKSAESGAGRLTGFHLPALTFYEYIYFKEKQHLIKEEGGRVSMAADMAALNKEFIDYLNFGGYPEALFSEAIKSNPGRYVRSDIIDKVLLRDLPVLYGIEDIQELNRLFMVIAYNTGNEVSLDGLSKGAGVAKNTIKKYLEYLEAAFLIKIIHRIDQSGKKFRRANFFKVYLANPSLRCALYGPISKDDEWMGNMAETAVISHFLLTDIQLGALYYARWKDGEVDAVEFGKQKIEACWEIKWSNRFLDRPEELKSLIGFARKNRLSSVRVTTIDKFGQRTVGGIEMKFFPASRLCYLMGKIVDRNPDWRILSFEPPPTPSTI